MKKLTRFKLSESTFAQLTAAFEDLDFTLNASDPSNNSLACIGINQGRAIIVGNGLHGCKTLESNHSRS